MHVATHLDVFPEMPQRPIRIFILGPLRPVHRDLPRHVQTALRRLLAEPLDLSQILLLDLATLPPVVVVDVRDGAEEGPEDGPVPTREPGLP